MTVCISVPYLSQSSRTLLAHRSQNSYTNSGWLTDHLYFLTFERVLWRSWLSAAGVPESQKLKIVVSRLASLASNTFVTVPILELLAKNELMNYEFYDTVLSNKSTQWFQIASCFRSRSKLC